MRSKEVKTFVSFLFIILLIGVVSAVDTCTIKTSCGTGEFELLGVSDTTNSHGEEFGQEVHSYSLCCPNYSNGNRGCTDLDDLDNTNKIIRLLDLNNAHAEIKDYSTDEDYPVCYEDFRCGITSDCEADSYVKVLSLSGDKNAHIGEFGDYQYDICCGKGAFPEPSCGNNDVEVGEQCDPPEEGVCDVECRFVVDRCGDGDVDPGEECDPNAGSLGTCADSDFDAYVSGDLSCSLECLIDTSDCLPVLPTGPCGNNELNDGETCDGTNWGDVTECNDVNPAFTGGTLSCISQGEENECHFDTSLCTTGETPGELTVFWANDSDGSTPITTEIDVTPDSTIVYLVLQGGQAGDEVTFEIKEDDSENPDCPLGINDPDDDIETITGTIGTDSSLILSWTIEQADLDEGTSDCLGIREENENDLLFYFEVLTKRSDNLSITVSEGPQPGSPCDCTTELDTCATAGCLRCLATDDPAVCTWQTDPQDECPGCGFIPGEGQAFWSGDGETTFTGELAMCPDDTWILTVLKNSDLSDGVSVDFEIKEDDDGDINPDDNIRTGDDALSGIIDNGGANAKWTILQSDLDEGTSDCWGACEEEEDDLSFYFNVEGIDSTTNLEIDVLDNCIEITTCGDLTPYGEGVCEQTPPVKDSLGENSVPAGQCGFIEQDPMGCDVYGVCSCIWDDGECKGNVEFERRNCPPVDPICGDEIITAGETCDGDEWGLIEDCTDLDYFTGGILSCYGAGEPAECHFNTTLCTLCGNNVCELGENCSNCEDDCGPCVPDPPVCGDGTCDQPDENCSNCEDDCGACLPDPVCGNNDIEPGEECDGSDWGTYDENDCGLFDEFDPFVGELDCSADCLFDTSSCVRDDDDDPYHPPPGNCTWTVLSESGSCEDEGVSQITVGWRGEWEWDPLNIEYSKPKEADGDCPSGYVEIDTDDSGADNECLVDGTPYEECHNKDETLSCPSEIELPFFSWQTLLAAIIILAVVYYFLIQKGKKKTGKRKKRKK